MARESGSYREGYFATIAAANTALDAFLTAMDARLQVIGTAAITAAGTITMNVVAENAASESYTFKHSVTFDTDTVAIGVALTNAIAVVTALDAMAVATEGASGFTTVTTVDVTANINMTN
jgi:hypothetical protein